MTKIKDTLPFAVEQSAKYPVTIIDRNGDYIAEEVSDDDAQFIVTACNYHERLVEALRDIIGNPAGPDDFHERQQKGYRLLKELEESCKEK